MYSNEATSITINSKSVHMYICVCFIRNVSNIQQNRQLHLQFKKFIFLDDGLEIKSIIILTKKDL